ncbi:MAG: hypothetical protein HYS22_09095 [Deltaproteobacteria bacterium]|nr:hypothetical protein [Deltaproteobacteria bacterium]
MKKKAYFVVVSLLIGVFCLADLTLSQEHRLNFDNEKAGGQASGLLPHLGNWEIRRDATAPSKPNIYAQTSTKSIEDYFPLAFVPNLAYRDFVATVKIKPISGEMDQSGGIVFRANGSDNYYVLRIEALRGSMAVYKTVRGKRSMIVWAKADIKSNHWQALRVEVKGDKIEGFVDGQRVLTLYDSTFLDEGSIGIWTKSDAVTYFDDLTISKAD